MFSVGAEILNRVDLRYLLVHVPISHSEGQSTSLDQGPKEDINLTRCTRLIQKPLSHSTAVHGDAAGLDDSVDFFLANLW